MNNKQFVKKLIELGDHYEGDFGVEDEEGVPRMKGFKDKHKSNKPKRQKPEWKQGKDKEE